MFERWGLGDVPHGFPANNFLEIRVDGRSRLLAEDLPGVETAGKAVPQQALVRGLIAAFLADGGDLRFEVADMALRDLDTTRPVATAASTCSATPMRTAAARPPAQACGGITTSRPPSPRYRHSGDR
jgi:hypothetical protein